MDMTVTKLCRMLDMPEEVICRVQKTVEETDYSTMDVKIEGLTQKKEWRTAYKDLQTWIGPDEKGFKMLSCMMKAMQISYARYREAGIAESVFWDTMKCFTRFIGEYYAGFGCYGFDRAWWVGRQLSMQLFRIGELEYEFDMADGKRAISIHIPSDAVLTPKRCRDSYECAVNFIGEFFPEAAKDKYICCSWLLSPALGELLPEDSRINRFRQGFRVTEWDKESQEFMQWVYKRRDIALENLPEESLLQRNMKEYLLKGGKVGEAKGELVSSPWISSL